MSFATPQTDDAPIIETWARLARLTTLTFTATPGPGSHTGWAGDGHGDVTPRLEHDALRLFESGAFTPRGARQALAFRNVYRWQRAPGRLSLWHERFGAEAPVWLFDLMAEGPDRLVTAAPHLCGADVYRARLSLVADGLGLDWHITGPRKDECLCYRYRF